MCQPSPRLAESSLASPPSNLVRLSKALRSILSKAHLFDFVTCWSHWAMFMTWFLPTAFPSLFYSTRIPLIPLPNSTLPEVNELATRLFPIFINPSIVIGTRLSVVATSIFGSLILLSRGADCLPYIKHELYLHNPEILLPFLDSLPVIATTDVCWHGLPLIIVFSSQSFPKEDLNPIISVLTVGFIGGAFLLFEKVRGIDCGETYGLKGISVKTPQVLFAISLLSFSCFGAVAEPMTLLSGWHFVTTLPYLNLTTTFSEGSQILAAILFLGNWYFLVFLFGRLPGLSDGAKGLRVLIREAKQMMKVLKELEATEKARVKKESEGGVGVGGGEKKVVVNGNGKARKVEVVAVKGSEKRRGRSRSKSRSVK